MSIINLTKILSILRQEALAAGQRKNAPSYLPRTEEEAAVFAPANWAIQSCCVVVNEMNRETNNAS